MSSIPHDDLVKRIEAFCSAHDMSKSAFGKEAVGDPRFFFDLEAGRECRRATLARVETFMAQQEAAE